MWLGGLLVERRTIAYRRYEVGSIPGQVTAV